MQLLFSRRTFGVLIALFMTAEVSAQDIDPQLILASKDIDYERLKQHVFVMASDSLEGRMTGAAGQKKAAHYIANNFEASGLLPAFHETGAPSPFFQRFSLVSGRLSAAELRIGDKTLQYSQDFCMVTLALPPAHLEAVVQDNNEPLESAFTQQDNPTTMVLRPSEAVLNAYTAADYFQEVLSKAMRSGSKLVLIVPSSEALFQRLSAKNTLGRKFDKIWADTCAIVLISPQKSTQILFKGASANFKTKTQISKHYQTENVGAWLPGQDTTQTVVITAHYDHLGKHKNGKIYYGADDNGSGVAGLLEMAHNFGKCYKNGQRWHKNILFLAVSAEEIGLIGSAYYTDYAPRFPLKETMLNINTDMIGREDPASPRDMRYVSTVGSDWLSSELHAALIGINAALTKLRLDLTYNDVQHPEQFFFRSDQYNFAKYMIPVIFFTSPDHPDYHKLTDTPDKIDISRVQAVTQLMFGLVWHISLKENALKIDQKKY